jgi:copper chaperone CopZ
MGRFLFIILCFITVSNPAKAQFTNVQIRVDGLTCSACSYATQKSLLELDFVDSVKMDLNSNLATVTFKPSKKIDIGQLSQKVVDAGFSVGSLTATYIFSSLPVAGNTCFDYMGDVYHFVNAKEQTLNGPASILFIGKKFMNKTELKKWKGVKIENNCKQDEKFSGKVYNVTIL